MIYIKACAAIVLKQACRGIKIARTSTVQHTKSNVNKKGDGVEMNRKKICPVCGDNICGAVHCCKVNRGIPPAQLLEQLTMNEIMLGQEICSKHCRECEWFDNSTSLTMCKYNYAQHSIKK